MKGDRRGRNAEVRHRKPDLGRAGDGGAGVGAAIEAAIERGQLPASPRDDGISIQERRRRALVERANEPQGARRVILNAAFLTGQPIGEIERLRVLSGELQYLTGLGKRHG